ncbi:TetR family transcriptional regulator [Subtercola sp. Z020]|uniref:TetR/AcrR family transcriptional regulator n=1 Tax=Subtercola sp. Z020 TaxID=2080582 RepID=UPI000CE7552B|nr:TetR/AcrR family transcriptional regulator [Subtercola sp. Z020]PPF77344.1 TetR family transcriptional regulator [Subtercola sp. Z020]
MTSATPPDILGARQAGAHPGRPYDRSSDPAILSVALDLLADRPYERVTLDAVATLTGRAKTTLYRRWATKDELLLAAIRSVGHPPEAASLPDSGSLRGDLLAVIDSPWLGGAERRLAVFAGLASAARSSELLAQAIRLEVADPYADVYRRLFERAIERGEVPRDRRARIPLLAEVIPAMSDRRMSSGTAPADRDFFVSLVDGIVLPALLGVPAA